MDVVQTVMFGAISSRLVMCNCNFSCYVIVLSFRYLNIYYWLCSMDYLCQLLYLEWIIIFLLGVPGLRR